uniref:ABC-type xenobiotic transporter n=1 Tax=Meloidogyne enterolobii TaxID=390850 RepID=A0A6V7UMV1_MELEN|nr:unnamed protein product [Meloidogyne enterolobii]
MSVDNSSHLINNSHTSNSNIKNKNEKIEEINKNNEQLKLENVPLLVRQEEEEEEEKNKKISSPSKNNNFYRKLKENFDEKNILGKEEENISDTESKEEFSIKGRKMSSKVFDSKIGGKRRRKTSLIKEKFGGASFGEMLRYAEGWDWLLLTIGVLTSIFVGALAPATSLIFRGITDVLMEGQHNLENGNLDMDDFSKKITHHALLYFLLGVTTFISSQISMSAFSTLCERQIHRIRQHLFKAILAQEPGWFDRPSNQVGALTHKMSYGVEKIKAGMNDKVAICIQAISCCVAGIFYGVSMSWRMTLVMLGVSPFLVISFVGSATAASKLVRKEMSAYSAAGAVAEEVLNGIKTVTSFNAQYFEIGRYKKHLDEGRKTGICKGTWIAFFAGIHLLVMFGSMGAAFWYGTWLVLQGTISPGTVFAVFWSVVAGALRIGQALPEIGVIVASKLAAGELFSIIDRSPTIEACSESGMKLANVKGEIEFVDVHFTYPTRPKVPILRGVSFSVKSGESVALVGHSGCGKSTMVGLLMRFYDSKRGCVTLDGLPIRDLNIEWLRNNIALVQQEPILFADTVEANIRMGKEDVTVEEMIDVCRMANAHEFICKLSEGYRTRIGQGGVQLSGGQKQRLAIARALVRNPRILLLDEATSALDAESEQVVQEALERASSGRTTITIAHRLSTVRNVDRIIVFERGQIVETGNHEKLMSNPDSVYRQLVLAQQISGNSSPGFETDENSSDDDIDNNQRKSSYHHTPRAIRNSVASLSSITINNKMARASERIGRSMTSVNEGNEEEMEELDEVMQELEAKPASVWEILLYARKEVLFIVAGVLLALCRGVSFPVFSIIYGRLFLDLSTSIEFQQNTINNTIVNITQEGTAEEAALKLNNLHISTIANSIAFLLLGFWGAITTFGSGTLLGIVGERLTQRLRLDVFRNILSQDGYFFDNERHYSGKLCQRLAMDAPNVQAAIDQRLAEVLQGIVSVITGVIVAFYFGWNVAPIGLTTAAILVIAQTSVTNYLKRRGMRDMLLAEDASRIAAESIEYVRTVQALNRQRTVYERFRSAAKLPHKLAFIRGIWTSLSIAISSSFVPFNFAITYYLGLCLIQRGYTTPFILFQVVEALNLASFTIMTAAAYFPEYMRAKLSAGLMFAMASLRPRIDSLSDTGLDAPITGQIDAQNIHFAYPNSGNFQLALNGFSLTALAGKTVALVGPSGCGKSTMIQLLERFYDPFSGILSIDGVDIRRYNIRHLRKSISLVGQEPTLFALSIKENITYGLDKDDINEDKIKLAAKLANIHDFIESLPQKYDTPVGSRGAQLSGGQKQRIAIARAIIRDPKILLLDEATSALDTESEKVVQKALEAARTGRTCLIIAHRLSTVQSADLIIVMREGQVLEMGTHLQLLQNGGLYYKLVQRQK